MDAPDAERVGDDLFGVVRSARDAVSSPATLSNTADGALWVKATRYYMAATWALTDQHIRDRDIRRPNPQDFMARFVDQLFNELRRTLMLTGANADERTVWTTLFEDVGAYAEILSDPDVQQSPDVTLTAGLRWFDQRVNLDLRQVGCGSDHIRTLLASERIPGGVAAALEGCDAG